MHICFVTNEFPRTGFAHGGVGSFVKTISRELTAAGIRVSVVGINYTDEVEESHDGLFSLYRLPRKSIKGLSWWIRAKAVSRKIEAIHKKQSIDIVETAELGLAFLRKIPGVKYVIRLHGGHHFFAEAENRGIDSWKGFQEKRSFSRADAFVAVSEYVKSHTGKYLSYHNKPVKLVRYPIDTNQFAPIALPVVPHSIVFAGTICEKKGVRQLIRAFRVVHEKYRGATLELCGRDWYYPDGRSYMDEMKSTELLILGDAARFVTFSGVIPFDEIREKYAQAAVCVFPSHMETQGLVAPEAMAMEKTVVFTNKGPGPETIAHGENGLLCDPHDPGDIAAQIIHVLNNPEGAAEMGRNARRTIVEKHGLEVVVKRNIEFYNTLLER